MLTHQWTALATVVVLLAAGAPCRAQSDAPLPPGVKAVWDLAKTYRETTPTRERVCINGLWRWQPASVPPAGGGPVGAPAGGGPGGAADQVPAGNWGFFKVPGCWPGITDYMQKDFQTLITHPNWKDVKPAEVTTAWYQREITIPQGWAGRRIALEAEYVNSFATIYVDGKKAGEIRFPAGEVNLTGVCRPGAKHVLSLCVIAMPLKAVMLSFGDTNSAKQMKGSVARRGLCGDVYLSATPAGARISDVQVDTSVRNWEVTLHAALVGLPADGRYTLRARMADGQGRQAAEVTSRPFTAADLKEGRLSFAGKWHPDKLWDINTPGNQYTCRLSLLDAAGKEVDDALPVRFGFREFWIDGRDFYLNGTRIYLSALPLDNAQVGAALASYDGAKESLLRLKAIGINFVYTHNYGCEPGTHLSFTEILRAADDVGILVSLSQPHFAQYDWKAPDADRSNGYARDAAFYVGVAGSHPSVVFYSMSHNATGYADDMNPDMIDGLTEPRDGWALNNAKLALRAEAIVHAMDPARIVYHHSSGNLSSMHTSNFYTNFAPSQELDDWFEHWATKGVKPVFTCEYMVPCTWDWTMYRGWYKNSRTWGSAVVPWDFSLAEWSAQFLGDRAYQVSEEEKENIRWEAQQYRDGRLWHRWDYPHQVGDRVFDEQHEIIGRYLTDNWRAFRTWGVSANSPWEHNFFWSLRKGADKSRKELPVNWDALQRPGFSPDYLDERYERMDLAFDRKDWEPTADGQAILRNNQPLLAYVGGKPAAFTSKDHLFTPGESFEKQLILINNSRETVTADCKWSLGPGPGMVWGGFPIGAGTRKVTIETGRQERIPLPFALPAALAAGNFLLNAEVTFSTGEVQKDSFAVRVIAKPAAPPAAGKVALFDPRGETAKLLAGLGIACRPVEANADLAGYDLLIVGKGALTVDGPAPDISRVRNGLKVLMFEQTSAALEKRLGFRVEEYGLRQVFRRIPDHPLLAGLDDESLRDWRGEATLTPPRLKFDASPRFGTAIRWAGIEVPHVWRCGNRGNVASVLIEKPARGDFLPILDGGYSLQYAPLMEYREGKGMVLFCQMDVTGRTESDPAAQTLAGNLLRYVSTWKPAPRRTVLYAGSTAGRRHLEAAGLKVADYQGGKPADDQVLLLGAGAGQKLAGSAPAIADFLKAGGHVLALDLTQQEADSLLPPLNPPARGGKGEVTMKKAEHIAAYFAPPAAKSLLAGISPADVHDRDPRDLPLVTGGATPVGDGVLATAQNVVFCQLVPYEVSKAEGALPSFTVNADDAAEGKQCALLTMGSVNGVGVQFGQKAAGGEAGKTYTFAISAKALDDPVQAHLEIERPVRPWDRAVKAANVTIPAGRWTEVHTTFKLDKPFNEGWYAYLACGQEGARLRVDNFRLYEGEYVPDKLPAGAKNLFAANAGFEAGTDGWNFPYNEAYNVRKTYRRSSFLLTRLLANMGAAGDTPLLANFSTPTTGKARESVVKDSDFAPTAGKEGLPDPWQLSTDLKDAKCVVENTAPGGGRCVRISSAGAQGGKGSVMLCQHDVPATQGQWYLLSLKARAEGFDRGHVTVALQDTTTWKSLIDYLDFAPTAEWNEFTFRIQAKGTAANKTRFQIWHGSPGTLWLADIRMEPCDPPTHGRWLAGLYLDQPEEWDDPYRFFRW